jgi:hypothetical protein
MAALRPEPSEMFFSERLVLVEGISDRAYVSAALHLEGAWETFRRGGLHVIPADGKSNILQLLIIAQELAIPCFVIFDADGQDAKHRAEHERDNKRLIETLGLQCSPFPSDIAWGAESAIWPDTIEDQVKACFLPADWERISNEARGRIDAGARGLKKSPSLIAEMLSIAWSENLRPTVLCELVERLIAFCTRVEGTDDADRDSVPSAPRVESA